MRKVVVFRVSIQLSCMMMLFAMHSCMQEENHEPIPIQGDPVDEIPLDNEDNRLTSVVIDTTDLYMLPRDTGGVMTIHELSETRAFYRHLIYTPGGYEEEGPEYPLLIFLHGWGPWLNTGADPPEGLLTSAGPPHLIVENKWDPTYPFIVVAPELRITYWNWDASHNFINYLIDNYQVNESRIYLTGLSLGGGGSWYYPGRLGEQSHVAAIVPICARGEESIVENLTNIPIWAFHGELDQTVDAYSNFGSVRLVEAINRNNPVVRPRLTVYQGAGHNVWDRTYGSQFYRDDQTDSFEVTIYDWMLQYRKP